VTAALTDAAAVQASNATEGPDVQAMLDELADNTVHVVLRAETPSDGQVARSTLPGCHNCCTPPPPSSYPDALISSFALPMQSIAVQVSTMANSRRTIIVMPTFNDCTGKLCHSRHSVVQVDHPVGDAPHTGVVNCSACSGDHICIHKAAVTFKLVEALDERGIDPGTDLTSDCIFSVDLTPNRHQLVYLTRGEASGVICGPVLLRLFPRPRIYLLTTHAPN
jgi:hypothetical protein